MLLNSTDMCQCSSDGLAAVLQLQQHSLFGNAMCEQ